MNPGNHQVRLMHLIEGGSWTYAVFWQRSSSPLLLSWGDGYYSGHQHRPTLTTASPEEQRRRKSVLRELCALIHGGSGDAHDDEDVSDPEWFFLVSISQSFAHGGGFFSAGPVGEQRRSAMMRERARQGEIEGGVQTMVFIPVGGGVIELGSTRLNFHKSEVVNEVMDLLYRIPPPWFPNAAYIVHRAQITSCSLNAERLSERTHKGGRIRRSRL